MACCISQVFFQNPTYVYGDRMIEPSQKDTYKSTPKKHKVESVPERISPF